MPTASRTPDEPRPVVETDAKPDSRRGCRRRRAPRTERSRRNAYLSAACRRPAVPAEGDDIHGVFVGLQPVADVRSRGRCRVPEAHPSWSPSGPSLTHQPGSDTSVTRPHCHSPRRRRSRSPARPQRHRQEVLSKMLIPQRYWLARAPSRERGHKLPPICAFSTRRGRLGLESRVNHGLVSRGVFSQARRCGKASRWTA